MAAQRVLCQERLEHERDSIVARPRFVTPSGFATACDHAIDIARGISDSIVTLTGAKEKLHIVASGSLVHAKWLLVEAVWPRARPSPRSLMNLLPASRTLVTALIMATFATPALAHRPFFPAGAHGELESAFAVRDPVESIVVNHVATCERQDLWLRFEATEGDEVYLQVGVPKVARFDDYRPSVALIGPGIDGTVPLQTGGLPGRAVTPLATRTTFFDTESQTESWVYVDGLQRIPRTGTYYVAAWPSEFQSGKFWVAVGTEERFTLEDLPLFPMWLRQMNEFYEKTAGGDPVVQCEPDTSFIERDTGGCQSGSGSTGPLVTIGVVAMLLAPRRRRRSRSD
jgi:hypothetical protein